MDDLSPLIFIRTDASLEIGSGHVMRCIALAEQLRTFGASVWFFSRANSKNLNNLIRFKEFIVKELPIIGEQNTKYVKKNDPYNLYKHWLGVTEKQDAKETIEMFKDNRPDWLIIDHYGLGETWENNLRPYVNKIMVIDDLANRYHNCDILLDQNYYFNSKDRYEKLVSPACTKLLGPKYALLRSEFVNQRKLQKPKKGKISKVLLFLGGTDPKNETGKFLEALTYTELSHLEVEVVLGANNPNIKSIKKQVKLRKKTHLSIQTENISKLMAKADVGIGAGGITTWERLCLGLRSIVTILSENQKKFSQYLDNEGLQICIGKTEELKVNDLKNVLIKQLALIEKNDKISERCMEIVDGKGAEKIKNIILKGIPKNEWTIRKASKEDSLLFWHWVNDSKVRKNSFDSKLISWEKHQKWFYKKINDSFTTILLLESNLGPIGQVRFEKNELNFVIDYSISRQFRGLKLGEKLLSMGINFFLENFGGETLVSNVKIDNLASAKIFKKLGFKEILDSSFDRNLIRRFQLKLSPKTK